jgi:putative membrane protein
MKTVMRTNKVLREATILPGTINYQLWNVVLVSVLSIIGIVLLPIILPIAIWAFRRYYDRLEVVLTQRDLQVRRGILNHEEKTIPLEKITDLALFQGPLMRVFGIRGIRVETAGQSGPGALVRVLGIAEVEDFRDAVLEQRDRISESDEDASASTASAAADGTIEILTGIRDSLVRIEKHLDRKGQV